MISDTSVSLNKQKLEVSPRYLWLRWAKLGYVDLFPPFGQRGARVLPCHVTTGWFGQYACAFVLPSSSLSLFTGVFREGHWWQPPAFWGQIRSISPSGCYILDAMTISTWLKWLWFYYQDMTSNPVPLPTGPRGLRLSGCCCLMLSQQVKL